MRINYVSSGRWLSMHSGDILRHEIAKKADSCSNRQSWNLPTSLGTGTLLISLSHADSLLAMPAPDCPALSWRQEGMTIDYVFSRSWLGMHSDDILGHGIETRSDWLPNCESGKFPTSINTGRLLISLFHSGTCSEGMIIDYVFSGSWLRMYLDDVGEK